MDGQMDERMNERTNESPPVFYRTLSPSGPLPCFLSFRFTTMQSRATGIADHILPLGDLLETVIEEDFPGKRDILAGICRNVFPWQPTPIVNKASCY